MNNGSTVSGSAGSMVGILSLMHFLVDGLCVCLLYLMAPHCGEAGIMTVFILYNVTAFLSQPLTGWYADRTDNAHATITAGVAMLALATVGTVAVCGDVSCIKTLLYVTPVVLGLGNSLFHVWGGRLTTLCSHNDIRHGGVFVSTGAMGLSVGMVFASWHLTAVILLSICLLTATVIRCYDVPPRRDASSSMYHVMRSHLSTDEWSRVGAASAMVLVIITGLCAIVALRSMAGSAVSAGLQRSEGIILAIGFISMLGKAAGGWVARRTGLVCCMVVAAAATWLCWMYGGGSTVAVLAALFLINLTMPVTLYLANITLQGREGLAFGLLAAALIPGYLIATV